MYGAMDTAGKLHALLVPGSVPTQRCPTPKPPTTLHIGPSFTEVSLLFGMLFTFIQLAIVSVENFHLWRRGTNREAEKKKVELALAKAKDERRTADVEILERVIAKEETVKNTLVWTVVTLMLIPILSILVEDIAGLDLTVLIPDVKTTSMLGHLSMLFVILFEGAKKYWEEVKGFQAASPEERKKLTVIWIAAASITLPSLRVIRHGVGVLAGAEGAGKELADSFLVFAALVLGWLVGFFVVEVKGIGIYDLAIKVRENGKKYWESKTVDPEELRKQKEMAIRMALGLTALPVIRVVGMLSGIESLGKSGGVDAIVDGFILAAWGYVLRVDEIQRMEKEKVQKDGEEKVTKGEVEGKTKTPTATPSKSPKTTPSSMASQPASITSPQPALEEQKIAPSPSTTTSAAFFSRPSRATPTLHDHPSFIASLNRMAAQNQRPTRSYDLEYQPYFPNAAAAQTKPDPASTPPFWPTLNPGTSYLDRFPLAAANEIQTHLERNRRERARMNEPLAAPAPPPASRPRAADTPPFWPTYKAPATRTYPLASPEDLQAYLEHTRRTRARALARMNEPLATSTPTAAAPRNPALDIDFDRDSNIIGGGDEPLFDFATKASPVAVSEGQEKRLSSGSWEDLREAEKEGAAVEKNEEDEDWERV